MGILYAGLEIEESFKLCDKFMRTLSNIRLFSSVLHSLRMTDSRLEQIVILAQLRSGRFTTALRVIDLQRRSE
jgi:hypothetical protein